MGKILSKYVPEVVNQHLNSNIELFGKSRPSREHLIESGQAEPMSSTFRQRTKIMLTSEFSLVGSLFEVVCHATHNDSLSLNYG